MPKKIAASHADVIAFDVLDKWFEFRAKYGGIPGLQVAIRKHGTPIYSKAFGYANMAKERPYTPRHAGHIASHSKMFTACAALQLALTGAFSINDPVVMHLPWLKQHRDKRVREITLRDLMTNRSGLFRDGMDSSFWEMERPFLSDRQLQNAVMDADLVFDPNTVTKYSNIGFGLLGMAMEKATGATYDSLMNALIISKLPGALLMTDYGLAKGAHYADGHSKRFYRGKRKIFRHAATDAMAPATGFCANMESTTQFLSDLYFTDKFLPRTLRRDMTSMSWTVRNAPNEFYGLGTQFNTTQGNTYIGHSGGYPGFTSQTRLWSGSGYICGAIVNVNELFSFSLIRSMAEVVRKVADTFPEAEWKKLEVTEPMMNKWGSSVYIIGKTRALGIPIETWQPADEAFILDRRLTGEYHCDKITGYASLGEEVKFLRRGKKVYAVRFGGHTAYNRKDFMKRAKKAFE